MHNDSTLRKLEKLKRELGSIILDKLSDSKVVEIMLNEDGSLWEDRLGFGMSVIGDMSQSQAESLISTISSLLDTEATKQTPIVEGELALDGSRFEGILPPISKAPIFAIRKKAELIYSLDNYVSDNILSLEQQDQILTAIKQRWNILVVGGTGSGKTTLCNAILHQISLTDPETRMAIIEDTRELQCSIKNKISLRTSEYINMTKLLKTCLRMRPDRIVVGEVRGPEALDLLKAWNTGHPGGVATIHANNALAGLDRLEQLIEENNMSANKKLIASAVNMLISIQRSMDSRKVQEIVVLDSQLIDGEYSHSLI